MASARSQASSPASSPPGGAAAGASPRETWAFLLVLAGATLLAYSSSFHASFHFDDASSIVENERLRDLRTFWPPAGSRWLGYLSFALNYRVGGLDVLGFHVVNVGIHACSALLVFSLAAATLRTPALRRARIGPLAERDLPFAAALLFAVHPIQTQAVTYVVQRFASLATLFYLLSLVLYVRARLALGPPLPRAAGEIAGERGGVAGEARWRAAILYALSLAAAAAAMETKEIAITLPVVAAAYELLFLGASRRSLLLVPLAATALLVPLSRAGGGAGLGAALGSDAAGLASQTHEIPRSLYLLTQTRVVATYLRLLVLPIGQNFDPDFRLSRSLADPAVLAASAVLLAVAAFAVLALVRARRTDGAAGTLVFFGVAWFFVTISVESSAVPIRDLAFEHRVYLPSAGAAIAAATLLTAALDRLRSRGVGVLHLRSSILVVAAPLAVATWTRNLVWKDDLSLWMDVVAKSPDKARPYFALAESGRLDDAIAAYRRAADAEPGAAIPHYVLGRMLHAKGRLEEAVQRYREAIRLDPSLAAAHGSLGHAYHSSMRPDDALREYVEALRLDPELPLAHQNLGDLYVEMGRLPDAEAAYRTAIRLDPGIAMVHNNLGGVYFATGRLEQAAEECREAIRLDPSFAAARRNLAGAYRAIGRAGDAERELREAARLEAGPIRSR